MKRLLKVLGVILAIALLTGGALILHGERQQTRAVQSAGLPIAPVYQFDYPAAVCFAAGE